MDFEVFSKIPVSELVLLLKNSRITYVPTTFELFGHVGAESLICGTPVILDTYHPFLELVPKNNRAVKIASTNISIATQVLSIIEDKAEICDLSNEILEKYSPEKSAMALLGSLNIKANI